MTWHYERLDRENVVFLIQVLAGKRLIANFPEVNTAHRCVWRTSDRPSDCWCRAVWGYFQTSFITSFRHQLQNGGGKIDGWRGLVNMRDWNDTQTVLFVVVRVTAHILKRRALRFTRSTLIPIKQILTCYRFCVWRFFVMITYVHMANDFVSKMFTRLNIFFTFIFSAIRSLFHHLFVTGTTAGCKKNHKVCVQR